MQFVCLDGKDGGNVLKCFSIPKYWKTTIPYSFCDIETNCDLFVPSFSSCNNTLCLFLYSHQHSFIEPRLFVIFFWLKNLHMVKRFFTFYCCYKRKTMLECLFLWKCKWKMVVNCLLVSIY